MEERLVGNTFPVMRIPVSLMIVASFVVASGGFAEGAEPDVEMVRIPAGCFRMGSKNGRADEKPVHRVCLDSFAMDVTEVTQGAYRSVVDSNPANDRACGDRCPVEMVSWTDAQAYCLRVGKRLPTEAQWEYAARAGSTTEWSWGGDADQADRYAWNNGVWFDGNSDSRIHPVGKLQPNAWGLYDMFGNVSEWTSDWYGERYSPGAKRNPSGPKTGSRRVVRGGGWHCPPVGLRSAARNHLDPGRRDFFLGFRCVGSPSP